MAAIGLQNQCVEGPVDHRVGVIFAHPGISAGAASLENQLVDECVSVATAAGHPLDDGEVAKVRAYVSQAGSIITTSMVREMENDSPIEADQIIGDMMRRASSFSLPAPILSTVHAHLKSYELRGSQRIAA
ncbi:ketopantoate reductase C-terminal domain-containing protein [Mesorhizobium japonicum]|uniref:ketopantoate reductase C-terminal domain-containing protein n=1 Tax=Mesorhizobium japonicum TaxID=2066070 RepID=UPI003B5916DE